jgi:antirestriction protein ArdC
LVAEFASAFLCAEVGLLKQVENQVGYINGWLKALHNDPNMLMWSASRAEKAANHILGKEKRN